MSFDHLHTALQSHVEGDLLPADVQRWLSAGLAAFVDGEPLERALGLTRGPHRNVYTSLHVVRNGLNGSARGGKDDVVAVLGLVADFDDDNASDYERRVC